VSGVNSLRLRRLFLGLALFAIVFGLGFTPVLSGTFHSAMTMYGMLSFFSKPFLAFLFLVGIGTFLASVVLLLLLSVIGSPLSRRDERSFRSGGIWNE